MSRDHPDLRDSSQIIGIIPDHLDHRDSSRITGIIPDHLDPHRSDPFFIVAYCSLFVLWHHRLDLQDSSRISGIIRIIPDHMDLHRKWPLSIVLLLLLLLIVDVIIWISRIHLDLQDSSGSHPDPHGGPCRRRSPGKIMCTPRVFVLLLLGGQGVVIAPRCC
jgi:hypothetical protein